MKIIANFMLLIWITFTFLSSSGCSDKQTGPIAIKWDRDACDRCQMMLSDRKLSAQIRVFPAGKRSKVFRFDDIGCASLWFEAKAQQLWQADEKTEFWVTDMHTGHWIDAKKSWYIKAPFSPMNYGLAAISTQQQGALNFQQAVEHINTVEKQLNIHGGNLKH